MNPLTTHTSSVPINSMNQGLTQVFTDRANAQAMQNSGIDALRDGFTFTKEIMEMLGVKEEMIKSHIRKLAQMPANNLQLPFQQTNYAVTFALGRHSVDSIMPKRLAITSANDIISAALSHEINLNVQPILGDTYEVTSFVQDTSYFWFTTYFEKDTVISFNSNDLANRVRGLGIPDIFGNALQTTLGQVDFYRLEDLITDAIRLLLSFPLGNIFSIGADGKATNGLMGPLGDYSDTTYNYESFKGMLQKAFNIKNDINSFSGMVSIGNFSDIANNQKTYESILQASADMSHNMQQMSFEKYVGGNVGVDIFEFENIKKFYLIYMVNYMIGTFLVTIFKLEVSNHYQALSMMHYGSSINLMGQDKLMLLPQYDEVDQKRKDGSAKLGEKSFAMVFDEGYCGGHIDYADINNNSTVIVDTVFYANGSSVSQGAAGRPLEAPTMEALHRRLTIRQETLLKKDGMFVDALAMPGTSMNNPVVLLTTQAAYKYMVQDIKRNSPYFNQGNMPYNLSGLDGAYLDTLKYLNAFASGPIFENGIAVGAIIEPVFPITLNKVVNISGVSQPQDMITYFVKFCVMADREFNNISNPLFSNNPDAKKILCTDRDLNNHNRSTSMFQHSTKFVGGKYRSAVDNIDPAYVAIKTEVNTALDAVVGGRPNVVHMTDITHLARNHTYLKDESGYTVVPFQQILDQFKKTGRFRPVNDITIDMIIANNSQLSRGIINPLETRFEFIVPSFTDTTGGYIRTTVAIPN